MASWVSAPGDDRLLRAPVLAAEPRALPRASRRWSSLGDAAEGMASLAPAGDPRDAEHAPQQYPLGSEAAQLARLLFAHSLLSRDFSCAVCTARREARCAATKRGEALQGREHACTRHWYASCFSALVRLVQVRSRMPMITIVSLLLASAPATPAPRVMLSVQPLMLLPGLMPNLEFEGRVGEHLALYFGGGYNVLGLAYHAQAGARWLETPQLRHTFFLDVHVASRALRGLLGGGSSASGPGGVVGFRQRIGHSLAVNLGAGVDLGLTGRFGIAPSMNLGLGTVF